MEIHVDGSCRAQKKMFYFITNRGRKGHLKAKDLITKKKEALKNYHVPLEYLSYLAQQYMAVQGN